MEQIMEIIPAALLQEARAESLQSRQRLLTLLEEKTGLAADAFVERLARTLRYPWLTMDGLHALKPAFDVLVYTEALQRECVAFRDEEDRLLLVFGDPFDATLRAWAEERIRAPFTWHLAHLTDIAAYLALHEETMRAIDGVLAGGAKAEHAADGVSDLSLKSISEDTSPVVKLVNSTIYDALKAGASDIHLETGLSGMTVKYRIDGVLSAMGAVNDLPTAEQAISRIKVMAELDIGEKRVPQDGRFRVSIKGREVDFRVSIMPSIHGEDAVLRILDKQALADHIKGLRLDYLGFDEKSIHTMRRMSNEPYGMLLVTGPTGSGKTTTLYAAISEINHGQDKIVTI